MSDNQASQNQQLPEQPQPQQQQQQQQQPQPQQPRVYKKKERGVLSTILSIIHSVVVLFAIYVSFNCNKGFNFLAFLAATVMPYIYLMWVIFKNGLGLCGAINLNKF